MPKAPYSERGRPEKNPARLRRERAYARGASRPGDKPNEPWKAEAAQRGEWRRGGESA